MEKLYYSWRDIEELSVKIYKDSQLKNFTPDCLVPISRGGLIPGRLLSELYNVSTIYPIRVQFYKKEFITAEQPRVDFFPHVIHQRNVLIIDDIMDSGKSIQAVLKTLNSLVMNKPKRMLVASLLVRKTCKEMPSFYGKIVEGNEWCIFPWESITDFKEVKKEQI